MSNSVKCGILEIGFVNTCFAVLRVFCVMHCYFELFYEIQCKFLYMWEYKNSLCCNSSKISKNWNLMYIYFFYVYIHIYIYICAADLADRPPLLLLTLLLPLYVVLWLYICIYIRIYYIIARNLIISFENMIGSKKLVFLLRRYRTLYQKYSCSKESFTCSPWRPVLPWRRLESSCWVALPGRSGEAMGPIYWLVYTFYIMWKKNE